MSESVNGGEQTHFREGLHDWLFFDSEALVLCALSASSILYVCDIGL